MPRGRIEVPQLARDLKNMNDAWEKQALSFLYTFCSRKIQILQDHLPSFAFRLTNLLKKKEKMEKHEKNHDVFTFLSGGPSLTHKRHASERASDVKRAYKTRGTV